MIATSGPKGAYQTKASNQIWFETMWTQFRSDFGIRTNRPRSCIDRNWHMCSWPHRFHRSNRCSNRTRPCSKCNDYCCIWTDQANCIAQWASCTHNRRIASRQWRSHCHPNLARLRWPVEIVWHMLEVALAFVSILCSIRLWSIWSNCHSDRTLSRCLSFQCCFRIFDTRTRMSTIGLPGCKWDSPIWPDRPDSSCMGLNCGDEQFKFYFNWMNE